jgi:hypothetical protein
MIRSKAFCRASIASVLICVIMLTAIHEGRAQTELGASPQKKGDLVQEIERLRAELERARAQVASLTDQLGPHGDGALAEKQKLREDYLQMLRKELLERRHQLDNARLELEAMTAQEKSLDKASIPLEKLSTLINKDAVIENARKEIDRLQDMAAEIKKRNPQADKEAGYVRAVAQIDELQKFVQARKEKIRPELEKQWKDQAREALLTARTAVDDKVTLLANVIKKLETQFENAAKQAQDTELHKAKAQLDKLKQQLEQEKNQSQEAAREAAAQRDALHQAEVRARQQAADVQAMQAEIKQAAAEQARLKEIQHAYVAKIQAAQEALTRQKEEQAKSSMEAGLADLEQMKEQVLRKLNVQKKMLTEQLKHLEDEQQGMLADLERKARAIRERTGPQVGNSGESVGKTEQILQRLQQIEKRLDRLEKSPQRASGQSP